jgi:serine/threonine protein kinase/Tfp pilus assembly protein PilF
MLGQRVGHYQLVAKLGEGGMGVVYRARDDHLDREVAIKVLPSRAFSDESARRRFRQEALALAKLSSPHIAHVYDFTSEGGVDFLVMELVPGRSLAEALGGGALGEREASRLGVQLASALEEAHAHAIVHRDLKPGNLMVTPRGELKVLDFGLARLARDPAADAATRSATEIGAVAGTLPYMAPEQLRGEAVDARADLWAAGVVLYELASGQKPFRGQTVATVTDAILNRVPGPLASPDRRFAPGLDRVVAKCLEKDPERRYQSARELRVDLERLLASAGTGVGSPAAQSTGRRRWIAGSALLAIAAIAVALGAMKAWRSRAVPAPPAAQISSLAVLPLANMTGDPAQEYFSDGMTEALITELAKVRSLKVISRTSVMRFKKSETPLPEIAKQLGVEGIIEGSVARSGGRVRVTAQLIRASSDAHLWADSFDRQEADVLTLQSSVAQAIAANVRGALTPEEARRFQPRRKVNPAAYDLVLQGAYLLKSGGDPAAFQRAIALFEKAVTLDPQSAEAHAGLANALQMVSGYGFGSYWEVEPRIRKEVDAALALDENCAAAHTARGHLLWAQKDPGGAVAEHRRALELDPGDATAITTYVGALSRIESGPEIERLLRKAIEIDPLAQLPRCNYKDWLYGARRFAEAAEQARTTLDLDPRWFWAWDQLWRIHLLQGKEAEAQVESRRAWSVVFGDEFEPPAGLSWDAYEQWLNRYLERQPRSWVSGFLAASFARRGQKRKALDYLDAAAKENSTFISLLDWPDFDPIRDDPRFQQIVEAQQLPVAMFCRVPSRSPAPK